MLVYELNKLELCFPSVKVNLFMRLILFIVIYGGHTGLLHLWVHIIFLRLLMILVGRYGLTWWKKKVRVLGVWWIFMPWLNINSERLTKIRSDNGLEFFSEPVMRFCENNGILWEMSCIDTPQQNSRVKRKQRHILEVTRALQFQANLPITFWREYVMTTTYLIN